MDKLEALRAYMEQNGVEGVLLANPSNVTWLTGFSGDSAEVLVTMHHAYLVTDSRYTEQAEQEAGERFSIEETTAAERLAYLDGCGDVGRMVDKLTRDKMLALRQSVAGPWAAHYMARTKRGD